MWNPKAIKHLQPKRPQLDAFDLEAEAQGNATRFFKTNEVGPKVMGRRISRESRKADGFAKTADFKATRNLVADTAAVYRQIVVRPSNLAKA